MVLVIGVCLPGAAFAAGSGEAHLVSRSVTTVSGVQLAEQMIRDLDRVELGSDSATVWLDVDGQKQAIDLEYGDALSSAGVDGGSADLVPLAILSAFVGGLLRLVRVLTRLGRS